MAVPHLADRGVDSALATWLELAPEADADPERRAAGLALDVAVLERCDGIVLVGGRLTEGMVRELGAARAAGLEALDFLHMGAEPPTDPDHGGPDPDAVDLAHPEGGQRLAPASLRVGANR